MNAAQTPIRIAVVGLGPMGLKHARTVAAHPRATLAMAVEPNSERARVALGCMIVADAGAVIGEVDAAIIAVPTALHATVAEPLLKAGIDCLIEKPFVASPDEATRVAAAARAGNATVRVGHIERFNPAVTALLRVVPANIRAINARRINGASARVTDIDVIMDLMVHDLDVVLALKRGAIAEVTAEGTCDHATALLAFADGTLATLTASRIAPLRLRDLDVLSPDVALHVDYVARSLTESRFGDKSITASPREVAAGDALTAQLEAFLDARDGADTPVTMDEALAVMDLAWRIQAALKP